MRRDNIDLKPDSYAVNVSHFELPSKQCWRTDVAKNNGSCIKTKARKEDELNAVVNSITNM